MLSWYYGAQSVIRKYPPHCYTITIKLIIQGRKDAWFKLYLLQIHLNTKKLMWVKSNEMFVRQHRRRSAVSVILKPAYPPATVTHPESLNSPFFLLQIFCLNFSRLFWPCLHAWMQWLTAMWLDDWICALLYLMKGWMSVYFHLSLKCCHVSVKKVLHLHIKLGG